MQTVYTSKGSERTGEDNIEPQAEIDKHGEVSAAKFSSILLKLSSELIRVYLWFLKFSNYLLRLV